MENKKSLSEEKQALLALRLRGASARPVDSHQLRRRPDDAPAPLSFSQLYIWAGVQLAPGNPAHNLPVGFQIKGRLNAGILEDCFNVIVSRHEALRTTFSVKDGEPIQVIHPEHRIKIKLIELGNLPAHEAESRLRKLASEESVASFDLSRLPLIRVSLYRLGETDYVLIINLHHIVADGLSIGPLLNELDALYSAFNSGRPASLPELSIQYADFAYWQRRESLKSSFSDQARYWHAQMQGQVRPLALPFDKARPIVRTFKGANVFFSLPRALSDKLNSLDRESGGTFFSIALALLQVLLHRCSGSDDMLILTPVSNRTQDAVRPLIGDFLNLVPLRCDVSGNPTFVELLKRSRETTINALSNSELPFDRIVDGMRFERDSGRDPVFQVLLQVLPCVTAKIADLEIGSFPIDLGFSQFDLSLHLYERSEGYIGRFEYSTEVFNADTVERLSSSFMQLLEAAVADPNRPISALPFLNTMERHQLLAWAGQGNEVSGPASVPEMMEAQTRLAPERTAVRAGTTVLSYGELSARARRLSRRLRILGVSRGQRVGLCVERGTDMVVAVLGILESGAAIVPLDPAFPASRLRLMVEDAQMAALVSTSALAELSGLSRERQVLLDADVVESTLDIYSSVDAEVADPEDPAYVVYVSDPACKPRGVVIPHRAVVSNLIGILNESGLNAQDILVDTASLSFDIAALELLLPLAVGATLVIASRDKAMDGQALKGLLEEHRASVMQATPVTWRLLLEAGWKGGKDFKALVGGEALPKDLADQLIACGVELWNMYGPTETTVWSTCARINDTANGVTIGRPIANTTAYVLDAHRKLCPIGVAGELCIGGAGVTLGYWRRPELTAERFIADPFSTTPGATLYRTGDRARWRADGTLEQLGRLDFQVKLRGFRVELGEIETVLAEHPDVRQAAVHLWTVKADDVRIVACCVPVKAGALAPVSLRRHLRARLPEYMIPQHFLPVEEIPLLPNGKVDRRRLPTPVAAEGAIGRYEAPADPVEVAIAEIWTQLIQLARPVSRNDRFFEIGGYSLLALRALQRIEQNLGVRLDFQVLIQQSLTDIAQQCRTQRNQKSAVAGRVEPPFMQGHLSVPVFLALGEIVAMLEMPPNAEMHTRLEPGLWLGAALLRISAIGASAIIGGIDTFA